MMFFPLLGGIWWFHVNGRRVLRAVEKLLHVLREPGLRGGRFIFAEAGGRPYCCCSLP